MQIIFRSHWDLQLATRLIEQKPTLDQLLSQGFKQPVTIRTLEFESATCGSAYYWETQIIVAVEGDEEGFPTTRIVEVDAEGKGALSKYLRHLLRWFYRTDVTDPALGQEFWTNSDQIRIEF